MLPSFLAIAISLYFVLDYLLGVKKDKREPPFLRPALPWFGHAYQIFTKRKTSFYVALRQVFPGSQLLFKDGNFKQNTCS